MNPIEAVVYNIVKRNPNLKLKIRNAYQRACAFVPTRKVESPYEITVREGYWFGFHDKCPWSSDGSMLLANKLDVPLRMPLPHDYVEVGFFSGENQTEFHPVAKTRSWNYQQGCMLQWIGSSRLLVFNDYDGCSNVSRIYDPDAGLIRTLPEPVGAVSPDGQWAVSYSFERSDKYFRGYGYVNGIDPELHVQKPVNHGITRLNMGTGEAKLLLSVKDVTEISPESSMDDSFHWLTHCQFSPSSKRFVFFHRWTRNLNALSTRMISCDLEGANVNVFPTTGMVSHVAWRDGGRILAYCRVREGDRYALFEDCSQKYVVLGEGIFDRDGHPSFSPDGRWVITDTYPDRFRISTLILFDCLERKRYEIARLKTPPEYGELRLGENLRCDLHPRWNRTGSSVCFDSAHTGRRSLCSIDLGDISGADIPRSCR